MAVTKEIKIKGVYTEVTDFDHSAQEIDDATTRALEGGVIDQLLAGKAPVGYGLGSSGASISDCNLATNSGFYKWGSACDNAPFTYGCMIVASRYNTGTINLAQLAFQQTKTSGIARRSVIDGVFGEWEWINPPMVIGVEYRTTERYQGKPVYVKLVNFGALPNATLKSIDHKIQDISVPFSIEGNITNGSRTAVGSSDIAWSCTSSKLMASTTTDMSTRNAYVKIKYTKTTD